MLCFFKTAAKIGGLAVVTGLLYKGEEANERSFQAKKKALEDQGYGVRVFYRPMGYTFLKDVEKVEPSTSNKNSLSA